MRKKTLTQKIRKGNWLNVTSNDDLYVGLDVHKKNIHAALHLDGSIVETLVIPADPEKVIQLLQPLSCAIRCVVYEAGPTGYSLARALQRESIPVMIVAPSEIPRPSKRGSKSDRLDCCALAEYCSTGLLSPIPIPSEQEEADRQLARYRDSIVGKRRRVKQQIKSFLLQHGKPIPSSCWSGKGLFTLSEMELCEQLRFCLDELLSELDYHNNALRRINSSLRELMLSPHHRKSFALACSHPGVGRVVATSFITELFALDRIPDRCRLASILGLAPRVRQSGQSVKRGPIVKAGKGQLRAKLVESSWVWMRHSDYGRYLYQRYLRNTGSAQKAITALARRLAINLWAMLRNEQSYDPQHVRAA